MKKIKLSQSAWKAEVLPLKHCQVKMVDPAGLEPATDRL